MTTDPRPEDSDLTERIEAGDSDALGPFLASHRERLRRMVDFRLDRRLRGRLDASDVVQEACLDAAARYDEYRRNPRLSPYLWLRFLAAQKLAEAHRVHLAAQARDVRRERDPRERAQVESARIALELTDGGTAPDGRVARREMQEQVTRVLESLSPLDREVLVMRHFEQMSNAEVASELGIRRDAASKRYLRALDRIREALG